MELLANSVGDKISVVSGGRLVVLSGAIDDYATVLKGGTEIASSGAEFLRLCGRAVPRSCRPAVRHST